MKRKGLIFALSLLACACALGFGFAYAEEAEIRTPEIIAEDAVINASSREIVLPQSYVYDSVDVGLTATAAVTKDGKQYPVTGGRFTADETGVYRVTYTAINSAGRTGETTVNLTVEDTLAPLVRTNGDSFTCYLNRPTSLPRVYVEDFFDTQITANLVRNGVKTPVSDTFTLTERGVCTLEITATENRPEGLSTTVSMTLNVVNQGAIYGFDDLSAKDGVWWGVAQAGNGTSDPEKYQVPVISENTDPAYVHDADGKSFKLEIEGRAGMSNSNSWPAIYTSELNLYGAKTSDYLVAWVYNDSADYDTVRINLQLNGSNALTASVNARRGEWTQIRFALDSFNGKTGTSAITSLKFFISGFESGKVTYYVDDLYFE